MSNDIVKKGYDIAAESYAAKRNTFKSLAYLEKFSDLVEKGRTILDVGCGAGLPVDKYLIERGFAVNGLDISPKMIALAKKNVPQAFYEVKDMSTLKEGEYCVDGIVSFYAIFHTPREKHQELFMKFASFMPKGGSLLVTMGASEWEGSEQFHGANMFWSHYGANKNTEIVENAGFTVVFNEIDDSGNEKHQIIIASLK